jgi:hypothetical protein
VEGRRLKAEGGRLKVEGGRTEIAGPNMALQLNIYVNLV